MKNEMNKPRILFVCSANKQRSKTGEDYFSNLYDGIDFKSGGTNLKICNKEGTNPLTLELVEWADLILVMEQKHEDLINLNSERMFRKKIKNLKIPDRFKYYQKELIEALRLKVMPMMKEYL